MLTIPGWVFFLAMLIPVQQLFGRPLIPRTFEGMFDSTQLFAAAFFWAMFGLGCMRYGWDLVATIAFIAAALIMPAGLLLRQVFRMIGAFQEE